MFNELSPAEAVQGRYSMQYESPNNHHHQLSHASHVLITAPQGTGHKYKSIPMACRPGRGRGQGLDGLIVPASRAARQGPWAKAGYVAAASTTSCCC